MVDQNPFLNTQQGVLETTSLRDAKNQSLTGFSQPQIGLNLRQATIGETTPVSSTPVTDTAPPSVTGGGTSATIGTGSQQTSSVRDGEDAPGSIGNQDTEEGDFGTVMAGLRTRTDLENVIAAAPVPGASFASIAISTQRAKARGLTTKNVEKGLLGPNVTRGLFEPLSGKTIRQSRPTGDGSGGSATRGGVNKSGLSGFDATADRDASRGGNDLSRDPTPGKAGR